MKKILLACNMGMSTSLLVKNMKEYAVNNNIELEIIAMRVSQAEAVCKEWDIVMLGPQVKYMLKSMKEAAQGKTPIVIIDMKDYGLMNGENVVKVALETMK